MDLALLVPLAEREQLVGQRRELEQRGVDPVELGALPPPQREQRLDVLLDQQRAVRLGAGDAGVEELGGEQRLLVLRLAAGSSQWRRSPLRKNSGGSETAVIDCLAKALTL